MQSPALHTALVSLVASFALGCQSLLLGAGAAMFYRAASIDPERVQRDIAYVAVDDAPHKQRFDFYLPTASLAAAEASHGPDPAAPWPTLVFVHGGGWRSGDRQYAPGGADVYANIGRYFAAHGIGSAVISYRLQPEATWREQVDDVAAAVHRVREHVAERGGDPDLIFLSGHSAGSHLSTRLALDPTWLMRAGIPGAALCGLIPVSGAAYDLSDDETYALGASPGYFEARFRRGSENTADWRREASVTPLVRPTAPAALVIYASGESADLQRQSELFISAFEAAGAPVERVVVPGESHYRIVLTLSRPDKTAAPAMVAFVQERATRCRAGT